MQIKELLTDDDAVSPVIGVILMVAITVILAAVIAAFVLGLGDTSSPGPQVSFDYDFDNETKQLTVKVASGDSFTAERVSFTGDNIGTNNAGTAWNDNAQSDTVTAESTVGAGERAELGDGGDAGDGDNDDVQSDFELEVVFTSEDGQDSSIISTRTGPDA